MKPVRLSTFPLNKPFNLLDPINPFSEVVLRLVVGLFTDSPSVIGTASILCGNLLVTAKHVIDDLIRSKSSQQSDSQKVTINHDLVAIQILPGPEYYIWHIIEATADPLTDLLLLHLGNPPSGSNYGTEIKWKQFRVNPFPPTIGERIAAIGYRKSTVKVSKKLDGSNHIDINDEAIISVGEVMEIFEWKKIRIMRFHE
ncbi:MAG: hypothetical protein HQL83_12580 [Magnetococcales bacterium]|nr:hypothetical protein [Magnetococcales bacterium]